MVPGAITWRSAALTDPANVNERSAASTPESRGYIGERLDAETGLQNLNARDYDPRLGMFIQPDWWEVTKPGVGTNRYAYAGGDPVNGVDPGGNEIIFVDGTNSNGAWRTDDPDDPGDLYSVVSKDFPGQKVFAVENTDMSNEKDARTAAAASLQVLIDSILANDPYAEINIISHSHGGNVVKEYSNLPGAKPITRMINLGTPQRSDYSARNETVGWYANVYSINDGVQVKGGKDGNMASAGLSRDSAGRTDGAADFNIDASWIAQENKNFEVDHWSIFSNDPGTIHSPEVWSTYLTPILQGR